MQSHASGNKAPFIGCYQWLKKALFHQAKRDYNLKPPRHFPNQMCKLKFHLVGTELRKLEGQEPLGADPCWYADCTDRNWLE